MTIQVLQHVAYETPGHLGRWAVDNHHYLNTCHYYLGERPLEPNQVDMVIIMGGPMSVLDIDTTPWMKGELKYVKACIEQEKKIIGVCLGAQIIAHALGAQVYKNEHTEIGWFPVYLSPETKKHKFFQTLPEKIIPFHWHGDTFSIPEGFSTFGHSDFTQNQGFFNKNTLAFQFHIEITEQVIKELLNHHGDDISDSASTQKAKRILEESFIIESNAKFLTDILEKFIQ